MNLKWRILTRLGYRMRSAWLIDGAVVHLWPGERAPGQYTDTTSVRYLRSRWEKYPS